MPRLLIHFARLGPYHHARLRSAVAALSPQGWEVLGLETAGNDATYAWAPDCGAATGPRVITAFPGRLHEEIKAAECKQVLFPMLDEFWPEAVAIAGWGSPDARACLDWCRRNGAKAIVMSETREADGVRVWWKEWIKGRIIRRFDAALVGGKSHRDYLVKLGMPAGRIAFGYNVVDNAYFAAEAGRVRRPRRAVTPPSGRDEIEEEVNRRWTQMDAESDASSSNIQNSKFNIQNPPFFLSSNRFIERKNLARLIEAYALYANSAFNIQHSKLPPWDLCLLGDGEQKPALLARCRELGLQVIESAPWESSLTPDSCPLTPASSPPHSRPAPSATSGPARRSSPTVFFPGFRQIEELPRFYAHAGCFVHPALEEPWGLVINEAMACGLPILSGNNVGAAEELVENGVNGWTFDATDVGAMTRAMLTISAFDSPLSAFGDASRRILEERCPTQAFGEGLAKLLQVALLQVARS